MACQPANRRGGEQMLCRDRHLARRPTLTQLHQSRKHDGVEHLCDGEKPERSAQAVVDCRGITGDRRIHQ